MATKVPAPPIPAHGVRDNPALANFLNSLKEQVELWRGNRANQNSLDKVLTLRDFTSSTDAATLLRRHGVSTGGVGSIVSPTDNYPQTIPGKLTNLVANGALTTITLTFGGTNQSGFSYTEIWRSATNDFGTAVLQDTTTANVWSDRVGTQATTLYYWVRAISRSGYAGPINATAGTAGTTATVVSNIQAGTVNADRLVAASITASSGVIANAAITNAMIASLAVGTANIQNAAITYAKIGNAQVDTLKLAGQAVTIPVSAYSSGGIVVGVGATLIQSAYIYSSGAPIAISCSALATAASAAADGRYNFYVLRDAVNIYSGGTVFITKGWSNTIAFSVLDTPGAGGHWYYFYMYDTLDATSKYAYNRSVTLLEVKR